MTDRTDELTNQAERLDLRSLDIAADKREELLRLFPEARTEGGKVDFAQLQRALGEMIDPDRERYGLTWPGKAECFRTIQSPSLATLRPAPDESVAWDTTENVIIEGDNLEVLKLLQKSYLGKVKMIYIDPPYNTGNDFIYPDNYAESLKTYLAYTGQVDAEGRKFSTNTDTDGRFHSKWLNMMYPRLYLARNLLREDGVIFISIDDGEVANLRHQCDEIFGEENFVGNIVWQSRTSISNDDEISTNHNHTVVYARRRDLLTFEGEPLDESEYGNPDNDPRGPWKLVPLDANKPGGDTRYAIENPTTGVKYLPPGNRSWAVNSRELSRLRDDGRIAFGGRGDSAPKRKLFLRERRARGDSKTPSSLLLDAGTTQSGTRELMRLFDGAKLFEYPKPSAFIARLIRYACPPEQPALVLDFFAGAGSTAQAALEFTDAPVRFVLVQLPERVDGERPAGQAALQAGFSTVADITKERVRRVIAKLDAEDHNETGQDRGFRVFKLDESNIVPWDAGVAHEEAAMVEQLQLHVDHVRDDRSPDDILFEVLLKTGFPLSTRIESLDIAGTPVFSIADRALLICLSQSLSVELMRAIVESKPERAVFLDEGFANDDALKANASHLFKAAGITFRTV